MKTPELLLKLTIEYQQSVEARDQAWLPNAGGVPTGREPSVIAEEYGHALQAFLTVAV